MGGLILKDCYVLGKQLKLFLIIVIAFALIPNGSWCAFAIMYASMLPITTIGYDERAKWGKLAAMMPYSKTQIVLSKYLLGYASTLAAAIISFLAQLIYGIVKGSGIDNQIFVTIGAVTVVAFLLLAINLPLMFKLGVEKGRLIFLVLTVGLILGSVTLLDTNINAPNLSTIIIVLGISVIILNIISIFISKKVYKF